MEPSRSCRLALGVMCCSFLLLLSTKNNPSAFSMSTSFPVGGRSTTTRTTSSSYSSSKSALYDTVDPTNDGDESSSSRQFDVETARKQLESILSSSSSDDGTNPSSSSSSSSITANNNFSLKSFLESKDNKLPPPPPLSSIERDRRVAEIQLLKQLLLEEGNDATAALWALWYSERGSTAQTSLKQSEQLMGDPTSWKDCERKLTALIEEYGIYFVEPINRLATLYYLQGRFEDSYKLCQVVIQVKPWHFGALSGIVQVCIGMGDRNAARAWAERRLPNSVTGTSFPPFAEDGPINPRRTEWVEKAVATAKEMLKTSETNTQKSFFGKPEDYYSRKASDPNQVLDKDADSDAWQ
jgi:hypothetical protein